MLISVLGVVSLAAKILILILGIVGVLSSWGYNTTTLLAGLSLGGVTVALAAQKTIENLFGSVAVVSVRDDAGKFLQTGQDAAALHAQSADGDARAHSGEPYGKPICCTTAS